MEYRRKCRSELCRNCVRSPRNHPQTPTFTGSHREAFCGGKSLNRLREEVFRYHSVSVAGFAFQACSFNHSDISPFRIKRLRVASEDYRTRCRLLRPSRIPFELSEFARSSLRGRRNCVRRFDVPRSLTANYSSSIRVGPSCCGVWGASQRAGLLLSVAGRLGSR